MRAAATGASIVFLIAALAAVPALAQAGGAQIVASPGAVARVMNDSSASLREIDDPHSGARWFLFRDPDHPEGPGRLVLEDNGRVGNNAAAGPDALGAMPEAIVHAGDRLIVEEHTAAFDAWWEADALGRGPAGSIIAVRLKIGGRIVRGRILSSGHAVLAAAEARP